MKIGKQKYTAALGRLTKATGGATNIWQQSYAYDRFGNRTSVTATGVAANNTMIPSDGIANLAYDTNTNRITTSGFQYDLAGNQIRAQAADGSWLNFEYDTANQVRVIKRDDGTAVQGFLYGATGSRLMNHDQTTGEFIIYANLGGTTLAEYHEYTSAVPTWTKSYTYLGDGLLSTISNNNGAESIDFNHPDRLGTRTITNQQAGTDYEQTTLPFGTALNAESTVQNNKKRFTSYDRSAVTGLDYAVNRTYDSKQGRFTQVDPIKMSAASLASPQTLNLYSYCGNDSINHTDPSGLFWGSLFRWIGKSLLNLVKRVIYAAVKAAITAAFTYLTSGGNFGAAVAAFIGAFVVNLAFPKFGNVLTPSWNPNVRHPLNTSSSLNRYIIKNFMQGDSFYVPLSVKEFKKLIQKFFEIYGKKFRRCVWEIFSKDKDGNLVNTAQVMQTPGSKNVPYDKIILYDSIPGREGQFDPETGAIELKKLYRSRKLFDGTEVSGEEQFFRTFAHEYSNYLSWYNTGNGITFGVRGGIAGNGAAAEGLRSINRDDDTGANMERCVWGNTSF